VTGKSGMNGNKTMRQRQPVVLVLWGPHFDTGAAVSLVCGLRQAGVWVKLVGVQARPLAGQQGLALVADLTLGQVARLVAPIAGLAIPCAAAYVAPVLIDPRLGELWQRALADDACFVVAHDWPVALRPTVAAERLLYYPQPTEPEAFSAQVLAALHVPARRWQKTTSNAPESSARLSSTQTNRDCEWVI
jgi:hypothetical protein